MENGVARGNARSSNGARAWAKDALGAIAIAEGAICDGVVSALGHELPASGTNAFGGKVDARSVEPAAIDAAVASIAELCAKGQRVALVATAQTLGLARKSLRAIQAARLGLVVHALVEDPANAYTLAELGWGVLFASSVEESFDLTLIARRAAEDSGTPFFVMHERTAVRHKEPLQPASVELCEVYVGASSARIRPASDPAHPKHANVSERVFADRVPFALGSAMRELERLTGRHHDVIERVPASLGGSAPGGGDGAVVMVGVGGLGESLLGAAERLRDRGVDVGAVKLVAVRPFPAARLVKALSRALAVSVLESEDRPLAQSNPLTCELKAAFADALTWAPDYPGIGRIPRILSGVCDLSRVESSDIDRVVHNMFADERGKRFFVLGSDALDQTSSEVESFGGVDKGVEKKGATTASSAFRMRARTSALETAEICAELCLAVLSSILGLKARAAVRQLPPGEGGGFACDVLAS